MNRFRFEKDRRIKDRNKGIRNLFKLRKEIDENMIKDERNHFELKGENEAMKCRIVRDIINIFFLLNTKVILIEIKHFEKLKNILIKLDHI